MTKIPIVLFSFLAFSYFALAATIYPLSLLVLIPLFIVSMVVFSRSKSAFFSAFFFLLPFFGVVQYYLKLKALPLGPVFLLGPLMLVTKGSFKPWKNIFSVYLVFLISGLLVGLIYSLIDFQGHHSLGQLAHHMGWNVLFFLIPITGVGFYFLVMQENLTEGDFLDMFVCFLKGMLICAFFAGMQYIGIGKMLQTIEGRFGGTFMDSNVLGFIVGISIPMCLSLFFNNEFRKRGFLVPILFFLLYVSGSRSGFIIVMVACSLFFCLLKSWKKRGVFIALIFVSCSFFLFLVRRDVQKGKGVRIVHETKTMVSAVSSTLPVPSAPPLSPAPQQDNVTVSAEKRPGFLTKSVNYILASRGVLWDLAGRVIKDHWLFGVGLGRYMTVSQRYTTDIVNDNACNMYLQVAAEQGIIAAVVFIVMVLWVLWPFSRFKQSSLFHRATWVTSVGVLIAFVFGAHIVNSEANIFFWYLIAILGAPVEHHS